MEDRLPRLAADYLGLTVETVSRVLGGFEAADVIARPTARHVVVRDRAKLKRFDRVANPPRPPVRLNAAHVPLHSIATDPVPFNVPLCPNSDLSLRVLRQGSGRWAVRASESSFLLPILPHMGPFPTQAMRLRLLATSPSRANPLRAAKLRGDRRSANRVARPPSSETQSGVSRCRPTNERAATLR